MGGQVQAKITRGPVSADRTRTDRRPNHQRSSGPSHDATNDTVTSAGKTSLGARLYHAAVPNRLSLYVMATIIVAFSLFFTARLSVRGEIYPGIHAAHVPLGGLAGDEARAKLADEAAAFSARRVTLTYEDHTWTPTLAELGIRLNIDDAVYEAMSYGRDNHVLTSLLRPLGIGEGNVNVSIAIFVDQPVYDAALLEFSREAGLAPQDAAITVVDGVATITADRDGIAFDGASAETNVLRILRTVDPTANTDHPIATVALLAHDQPAAVRVADLAPVETLIKNALSEPMTFSGGGQRWTLATNELAKLIVVRPAGGNDSPIVVLNDSSLRSIATRIANDVNRTAIDAAVDSSGAVARLIDPQPGLAVRIDDFVSAINQAFLDGKHDVSVPLDETMPTTTTDDVLQQMGVTELLAVGISDFAGSEPGRVQNVEVSAKLVDGVMVPPGGEFTFNHSIGEINVTPGFVPAGASENGIAGTAVGGGVCQVTTTIFRAALKAGMPITEWWPHAYRNIYYEQGGWAPGFDASIQQPDDDPFNGSDLVFENPTDGWLLLRSRISDETILTIELYGVPNGYTVEVDDPIYENVIWAEGMAVQESVDPNLPEGTIKEIQPARDGMSITVIRRVFAADGAEISTDAFVSTYEPQGPSYAVSSDMAGSSFKDL